MNFARILIRLVLIVAAVGGGVYVVKNSDTLTNSQLTETIDEKQEELHGVVQGVSSSVGEQTQQLTERGQEVVQHAGNVLGTYVQPAEDSDENQSSTENQSSENKTSADSKPIYEETWDYGRYLYCQQVVKDYETNH